MFNYGETNAAKDHAMITHPCSICVGFHFICIYLYQMITTQNWGTVFCWPALCWPHCQRIQIDKRSWTTPTKLCWWLWWRKNWRFWEASKTANVLQALLFAFCFMFFKVTSSTVQQRKIAQPVALTLSDVATPHSTQEMFLGWRRMCELSKAAGSCQEDEGHDGIGFWIGWMMCHILIAFFSGFAILLVHPLLLISPNNIDLNMFFSGCGLVFVGVPEDFNVVVANTHVCLTGSLTTASLIALEAVRPPMAMRMLWRACCLRSCPWKKPVKRLTGWRRWNWGRVGSFGMWMWIETRYDTAWHEYTWIIFDF